jgi:hypothetical protein
MPLKFGQIIKILLLGWQEYKVIRICNFVIGLFGPFYFGLLGFWAF